MLSATVIPISSGVRCQVPHHHTSNYNGWHDGYHNESVSDELCLGCGRLADQVAIEVSIGKEPSLNVDCPCEVKSNGDGAVCSHPQKSIQIIVSASSWNASLFRVPLIS